MTRPINDQSITITASLQTKLGRFVDGLTEAEAAQLCSMRTEMRAGELTPSLREKLEQAANGLTDEEATELRLRSPAVAGTGATVSDQTDVEAFMNPLYDDGEGYKGRPRVTEGTGGGGLLDPLKDAYEV